MAGLFDLPQSRTNKKADKTVVNKSTNKRSALNSPIKGGIKEKISIIEATVNTKLGKYKDKYMLIRNDDDLLEYVDKCCEIGVISIDTETTGLDPISDELAGLCLYAPGLKGCYAPINHISYITNMQLQNQISVECAKEAMRRVKDSNIKVIMYNAKFDLRFIKNKLDVMLDCYFDGYIAGKLLNENEPSAGLKALHNKYCLDGKGDAWSFDDLFKGVSFTSIPLSTAYLYAARDPEITYELYQFQLPYLTLGTKENEEQLLQGVSNVFWNIEMPCIKVLAEMEDTGITLDVDYAQQLSNKYHEQEQNDLDEFYRLLDMYKNEIDDYKLKNPKNKLSEPISVSSPTQLAILFYDILKIPPVDDKSPRGTGVEILEKMDNPLCKAILNYRKTEKLLSTYIDKLPQCVNSKTKRVHCNFNQYGAKTGRMSSDNPNLQNIPSHNKDIRKMFIASEGCVLLSSDFSQQEPKMMTQMCQDPDMIKAYQEGKDLYASIASLAFDKPYEECLEFRPDGTTNKEGKERRSQAKSILLGILYGRGINSVAEQLHTTKQKAQAIQDKIFKGFPAIKQFEEDSINMAINDGYVTTFWGRKRRLPEMQLPEFEFKYMDGYGDVDPLSFDDYSISINVPYDKQKFYINKIRKNPYKRRSVYEEAKNEGIIIIDNGGKIADATRQCVNSRIQGSAADLTKLAGIEIYNNKRLRELGFKLLVPIHDEYLAECPIEHAKECAYLFSKCMSDAARDLDIPISTDVTISKEWYGEELNLR